MGSDKKTIKELKELLGKINNFEKDLQRLKTTLSRHIGQQKRQPSGQWELVWRRKTSRGKVRQDVRLCDGWRGASKGWYVGPSPKKYFKLRHNAVVRGDMLWLWERQNGTHFLLCVSLPQKRTGAGRYRAPLAEAGTSSPDWFSFTSAGIKEDIC